MTMNDKEKETGIRWRDYFYYDETSPSGIRWKVDRYAGYHKKTLMVSKGSCAGTRVYRKCGKPKGWTVHVAGRRQVSVPMVIYDLFDIKLPIGCSVDHINGNPFDNRIENLRTKTPKGQSHNLGKSSNNTSGFTGVCWVTTNSMKTTYARASVWEGKRAKFGRFSVSKYGLLPAFKLTCEWRLDQLKRLNELGAEYTFRSYNAVN